jgi:hypothetical protein
MSILLQAHATTTRRFLEQLPIASLVLPTHHKHHQSCSGGDPDNRLYHHNIHLAEHLLISVVIKACGRWFYLSRAVVPLEEV